MRKFPSIHQFRHVVESVTSRATYCGTNAAGEALYDASRPKPTLTFKGTVKLHGTNAGVEFRPETGEFFAQSRENVLSVKEDNYGFCAWTLTARPMLESVFSAMQAVARCGGILPSDIASLHAYGEWCGQGINGKTGIGQLSNRWVLFGFLVTLTSGDERWLSASEVSVQTRAQSLPADGNVFFITDFPQWEVTVDFNHPELALGPLEDMTLAIEKECPVALAMGAKGIGEGLVWTCEDAQWGRHVFKTKGARHKGTRNKRLVDVAPEVIAGQKAFVDAVLTDSRLEQGFELLRARHGKVTEDHIGDFLKWVGLDVLKEEQDTLEASGLDRKQVMGQVNRSAKAWLVPRLARV